METKPIVLITLTVFLSISATVRTDYARPQPRKTLHFSWNPKHPSQPQQVTLSILKHFLSFSVVNDFVRFNVIFFHFVLI